MVHTALFQISPHAEPNSEASWLVVGTAVPESYLVQTSQQSTKQRDGRHFFSLGAVAARISKGALGACLPNTMANGRNCSPGLTILPSALANADQPCPSGL